MDDSGIIGVNSVQVNSTVSFIPAVAAEGETIGLLDLTYPYSCKFCNKLAEEPVVSMLCGHLFCWRCVFVRLSYHPELGQCCPCCKMRLDISRGMGTIIPIKTGPVPGEEFNPRKQDVPFFGENEEKIEKTLIEASISRGEGYYVRPRPVVKYTGAYASLSYFHWYNLMGLRILISDICFYISPPYESLQDFQEVIDAVDRGINNLIQELLVAWEWLTGLEYPGLPKNWNWLERLQLPKSWDEKLVEHSKAKLVKAYIPAEKKQRVEQKVYMEDQLMERREEHEVYSKGQLMARRVEEEVCLENPLMAKGVEEEVHLEDPWMTISSGTSKSGLDLLRDAAACIRTFCCTICSKVPSQPFVSSCGYLYCWSCIHQNYHGMSSCPFYGCLFPFQECVRTSPSRAVVNPIRGTLVLPKALDEFLIDKEFNSVDKVNDGVPAVPCSFSPVVSAQFLKHLIDEVKTMQSEIRKELDDKYLTWKDCKSENLEIFSDNMHDMAHRLFVKLVSEWRMLSGELVPEPKLQPCLLPNFDSEKINRKIYESFFTE